MIKEIWIILFLFVSLATYTIANDCYESTIVSPSPFMGNNEETFQLADGTIWEVKYEYEYLYEYSPSVIICPEEGILVIGEKKLNVQLVSLAPSDNKNSLTSSDEWELLEETSLKGMISGTLKKGSILRTLSGFIFEITGFTIQVVVEMQPSVMILRRDDTYKLIVEGFDEPLLCTCLNCSPPDKQADESKELETNEILELVNYLRNSRIIAQDDDYTYLGMLSNEFDSESIFNEFGTYGNEFSSSSIWNEFSTFGNEFNPYSPFNEYSTRPPMIIKDSTIIAYLTTNDMVDGAISPKILLALKDLF